MKLKSKLITWGWEGNDILTIEFPFNWATAALILEDIVLDLQKEKVYTQPFFGSQMRMVIENYKNGEVTYILQPFHHSLLNTIQEYIKIIKKSNVKVNVSKVGYMLKLIENSYK